MWFIQCSNQPKTQDNVVFVKATGIDVLNGLNSEMTDSHKKRIKRHGNKIEKISVRH